MALKPLFLSKARTAVILGSVAWLFVTLSGCDESSEVNHVLVISIDGLPVTMLDDPRAVMPTIRHLETQGVRPEDGMRVSNPTVTWPNHASMVTGNFADRHGLLYNGAIVGFDEPDQLLRVDATRNEKELLDTPTIYDAANEEGMTTAAINWPATRNAEGIDHGFPDTPNAFEHTTPDFHRELVDRGILPPDLSSWPYERVSMTTRDHVWTRATEQVIKDHQPELVLSHLLNVDSTFHRYGMNSSAGYSAVALADAHVTRILQALEDAGIEDETAIFIVSDHGFKNADTTIYPNVMLRDEGLVESADEASRQIRAQAISVDGAAMVYLRDSKSRERDRDTLVELFGDTEGIRKIVTPEELPRYDLPTPENDPTAPSLVLEAEPGYTFDDSFEGDTAIEERDVTGHHGYLAKRDRMNAAFIAAGAGIQSEANVSEIKIIDLAPTIANLLELDLSDSDGEKIGALLDNRGP